MNLDLPAYTRCTGRLIAVTTLSRCLLLCLALAALTSCQTAVSMSKAVVNPPPVVSPSPVVSPPPVVRTPAVVSTPARTATTSTMRSLTLGRTQRSYLVVAPGDHHTALPLVMILHGRSVTVQQEEIRTDFLFLAQQGKAVLVYPVGYGQSWNADGGCCGDAATAQLDDSAFLAAVTGDVANHFSINGSRSYLVGYSNGARMAFTEVCAHPSLFAAFAV